MTWRVALLALAAARGSAAANATAAGDLRHVQNMTLASAVQAVGKRLDGTGVHALLQESHRHHRRHRLRHRHGARHHALAHAAEATLAKAGQANDAKLKLNDMVLESESKLDIEEARCYTFVQSQKKILEETHQDIGTYNAISATARTKILTAMATLDQLEAKMPELTDALESAKAECATNEATLKSQLNIILADMNTMGNILDMTQCSTSSSLLQCRHRSTGHAFAAPGHHALRKRLRRLRSTTAKRQVQAALMHAGKHLRHRRHSHRYRHKRRLVQGRNDTVPVSDELDMGTQAAKCSVEDSPNCQLLRDRFVDTQSGIVDKKDELSRKMGKLQEECAATESNVQAQIEEHQTRLHSTQTELAVANEEQNNAEEQTRLKSKQLIEVEEAMAKEISECKSSTNALKSEICGLKRIRQEVMKLESTDEFIQDCQVSEWVFSSCSVTCGGGTQQATRTVIAPAIGGAACPPLEMDETCSEQECPVDCEVSYWSGWSDCSAKCGGGIEQRSRHVLTQPSNGGTPCGETSETRECGVESCDKDCELGVWSGWGSCSKACGGGYQESTRAVESPAEGQGTCPTETSSLRVMFKECNEHACQPQGATLVCTAKLDVIILLDGSASLGTTGWAATLKAGEMLVSAFQGGAEAAQVGVVLFSGPSTYGTYYACLDGTQASIEDCGIQWVEHFTTDTAALSAKVAALTFPQASTFTSMALATAEEELKNGRADANSVVIVVTDGRPLSSSRTFEAARALREKARLMWVPVGPNLSLEDMEEWASLPVRDNMVIIQDFAGLEKPEAINNIIADACPTVQ